MGKVIKSFFIEQRGAEPFEPMEPSRYREWGPEKLDEYLAYRREWESSEDWEADVRTDDFETLAEMFLDQNESGISNADDALAEMSGQGIAEVEINFLDGSQIYFRPKLRH